MKRPAERRGEGTLPQAKKLEDENCYECGAVLSKFEIEQGYAKCFMCMADEAIQENNGA